jgi:hypothetical protein
MARRSLALRGKRWQRKDGTTRRAGPKGDPRITAFAFVTATQMRPIRYLIAKGFVTDESAPSSAMLSLSVTSDGADLVRRLGSIHGRIDLRYPESKDGLFGLLITIIVAAVTAMITTFITAK